jgi:hypothetical protein
MSPGARCEIDFLPQMKKFGGNYTSNRRNNFRVKKFSLFVLLEIPKEARIPASHGVEASAERTMRLG